MKRKRTTISIDGTSNHAGVVRPEFLSFTLDWWPDTEPGWEGASILRLDLSDPRLINAARALAPSFLRIGGWESDRVVYLLDDATPWQRRYCADNPDFCLTMERWQEILTFAERIGARVVFCLAYLLYIQNETRDWDGSNARAFLEYTAAHSPPGLLHGVELGNEPLHRDRSSNVTRHVLAYTQVREYIDTTWSGELEPYRPKLMGPSTTGVNKNSFGQFLEFQEFCDAIDVATYHDYRCGTGRNENLAAEAIHPNSFRPHNKLSHAAKLVEAGLTRDGAEIWIGEGSMAYNSGRENVTDSFENSFWYTNMLGQMSRTRHMTHSVFCRQALVGGWYDLLSHSKNLEPNPDFWLAVLWKDLMGTTSLQSERIGCCQEGSDRLLVYPFCARYDESKYDVGEGDVAMVLINIADDTSYKAAMDDMSDVWDAEGRLEFLIQAEADDVRSALSARRITINGELMNLGPSGEMPDITPFVKHDSDDGMILPPYSIMFAVLKGAKASLCMGSDTTRNRVEEAEPMDLPEQERAPGEATLVERTNVAVDQRVLRPNRGHKEASVGVKYGGVVALVMITAIVGIVLALKSSSGRNRHRRKKLHHAL